MTSRSWHFIACVGALVVAGCVSPAPLHQDPFPASINSNDTTAIIEGCGHQAVVGYAYCRKKDSSPASDSLIFHIPPVNCRDVSCVYLKVFKPSSDIALGVAAKKGQTRIEVPWKLLLGRDTFSTADRGFWPVLLHIKFTDPEVNQERSLFIEGEIRLRVYAKDYLPLHDSDSDPYFKWEFISGGHFIKITTKGRTYVAPKAP